MAHNNLEEAIAQVQQDMRLLTDAGVVNSKDEYTQRIVYTIANLANIVEGLINDVDNPMQNGGSLKLQP